MIGPWPRGRAWRAALASILVALAVGACSFTRPAPVKEMYLLAPTLPAAVAKPQPGTLRVGVVNVSGPFRTRNFVVRVDELRYETDYYAEFVTAPASMIAEATSRALATARVFEHVAPLGSPTDSDFVLDGFVGALYADHRTRGRCTAVLAITYYLSRADAVGGVPFWSKDYRREVACDGGSTTSFAAALNTAFSQVLADLATDLAGMKLPAK
jgi:cholesterol transport system auxiliary component